MNEGLHGIDGQRDELQGAELHLDEVVDQLVLLHRERHDRLLHRNKNPVQVRVVDHLQVV